MTNNKSKSNPFYSDLVTIETYSERKKKSLKTIYNWIKAGKLKPTYIDGKKFIKLKS